MNHNKIVYTHHTDIHGNVKQFDSMFTGLPIIIILKIYLTLQKEYNQKFLLVNEYDVNKYSHIFYIFYKNIEHSLQRPNKVTYF